MSESLPAIDAEAKRALEGAARIVAKVPICWLATEAEGGGVAARPMGPVSADLQQTGWAISFVTDGRSWKAAEIRRTGKATLVFQHDGEDAYVALMGAARLAEDRAELQSRWRAAFDPYFPTDDDRANAAFIDVSVERMDLWIRGVTSEPFGMRTTTLVRDASAGWAVLPPVR